MALRVVLSVPIFLLRAAKRISTAITHALVEQLHIAQTVPHAYQGVTHSYQGVSDA